MSTLKADTVTTKSDNTDLTITGGGTGVPNLEAGFKVGGSAGVPTASIQDDAVTLAKLAAGTDGELITWDASGDPATVAVGTATHVLTSNGAGAAPTFQAAAGGGSWNYITTVTASNSATVDIESQMDSTYGLYVVQAVDIVPATDEARLYARFGVGSSYFSTGDYSWANTGNNRETSYTPNSTNSASEDSEIIMSGEQNTSGSYVLGSETGEASALTCYIPNPSGTTYNKMCYWTLMTNSATKNVLLTTGGCVYKPAGTVAITSIQFYMSTGNVEAGTFRLYGIANS